MPGTSEVAAKPKRPRGRPRQGVVEIIDSELLEGALQEFVKMGYGGASLNTIVKTLGISKTTLYSRYPSKSELFSAIISQQIERLSASVALQVDGSWLELAMGLRAYANRSLEVSLSGALLQVNRLIYSESQRFPELGAAAAERTLLGIRQIADFITLCARRDQVPVRDAEGVAQAFIFMLRGWYADVMLSNRPVTSAAREAWAERAVHTIISGRADW